MAEEAKERGNAFFKEKHFHQAIEEYSKAIELDPLPAYYCNRAFAYLKTEAFGGALADANAAIARDPKFVKAYYRRASANMGLARWKESKKDFEAVLKVRPGDKDATLKLKQVAKVIHQLAFAKAIAVDEQQVSILDQLRDSVDAISTSGYDGAPLGEDGAVTLEFVTDMMARFKAEKPLHRKYVTQILLAAHDYFKAQPSLIDVTIPENAHVTVCGDTHGQFYDVLNIFELNGMPSEQNPYVFNGDFVDRGSFSCEVIITFLALKLLYPNHFFMSRGNHETEMMNEMYGFSGEVKHKYNASILAGFTCVFNWLPLGHIIDNKVLVVHGGLFSEDGVKIEDLKKIDRNRQPPPSGPMCDILWNDPQHQLGRSPSKRGTGCQFGPDVTARFLEDNGLELLIRSHEMKEEGYEVMHDGKCITIFSAPNYCDTMGNKGAFIKLDKTLKPSFTQFGAVSHPNVKPMQYAGAMSMFA